MYILQLVTVFFAFKLGTYPTTEEWSLMQAQEQEAVYGVNASSTYDSSVYDPTYAEPQYWDVAEDAAYQPTFESTHSKFCRSYREHCFATLYLYLERQRVNY